MACPYFVLLFQQLWASPTRRKVNPNHYQQGTQPPADTHLWKRQKYPRLALCRRPFVAIACVLEKGKREAMPLAQAMNK